MATLAEVDDVDGAARYIGKYLHMQSYHVRKYIVSAGWVLPRGMLINLGRMGKVERAKCTWFGLYLWESKHLVGKSFT